MSPPRGHSSGAEVAAEQRPARSRVTKAGKHCLYVRDTPGPRRPVVLVHGWPMTGESWSHQIPALQDAGYRVVVYDRRGFGRSGCGDGYGFDALADDLADVLDDLDLRDVTLVGFAMGGGEVARYLSRHGSERVRSVVLAAAVTPFLLQGPDNPDGPMTERAAARMREEMERDRGSFLEELTTRMFTVGDRVPVSEEDWRETLATCRQADQEAALSCLYALTSTDFRTDLAQVDVPTLVLHGDSDDLVPLAGSGARTHEAVEGSELVVVKGGPHGLLISHADEVNRALVDFLDGPSSA